MNQQQHNKRVLRLVPARPPGEEDAHRYRPRVPWRYVGAAVGVLLLVVLGYVWKEQLKAAELRERILRVHGGLAEPRTSYMAFRHELERLTSAAAAGPTDTLVAPDFQLADLQSGRGTYLRIPLAAADKPEHIAQAAKQMLPDWIPSCLGLKPTTTRELYEIGEFLLPSFVTNLKQKNVLQLRVTDDTLNRRIKTDLPNLLATTRSDWFMLVLQEGDNRRDQPVRAFIWDLKRDALLLRARVQSQGVVLSARILSQGVTPTGSAENPENSAEAVNDCSIASALKKLATP